MLIIASLYVEEDLSESDPFMTLELYDQQLKGANNKIMIIISLSRQKNPGSTSVKKHIKHQKLSAVSSENWV